jgi:hypothetical protein
MQGSVNASLQHLEQLNPDEEIGTGRLVLQFVCETSAVYDSSFHEPNMTSPPE